MKRLAPYGLDAPLDPSRHSHDLARGTVHDATGGRLLFLSADFIQGHILALAEETGDGWKIALHQTGQSWGRELASHLEASLAASGHAPAGEAPLEAHVAHLEAFFFQHGWGELRLDLSLTSSHGLITARLANSAVAALQLPLPDRQVDALAAGLLSGYFSALSDRELGCTELACAASGAAECVFVVTSPERLAAIDGLIDQRSASEILATLQTPGL